MTKNGSYYDKNRITMTKNGSKLIYFKEIYIIMTNLGKPMTKKGIIRYYFLSLSARLSK